MTAHAPLRVGILGLGVMGSVMATAFDRSPHWSIGAVHDPDPQKVSAVLDDLDATGVLVGERALFGGNGADLDVVAIATPPAHHAGPAIRALRAGRHVICEKPLALTVAEGRRMVKTAEATGLVAAVDLQQRYNPARRRIRALVRDGWVGTPRFAVIEIAAPEITERGWGWLSSREHGGGVLREYGSHAIDLVHWMFGEIVGARGATRVVDLERLDVEGRMRPATSDDAASVLLEVEGGLLVTVLLSNLARQRTRRFEVHGDGGAVYLDDDQVVHAIRRDGSQTHFDEREPDPSIMGWEGDTYTQPVARFLDDVAAAIRDTTHRPGFATFADALVAMEVIASVERTAAGGARA